MFHEFAVTQGAKSITCLERLREFFGVGQVLVNKRHDNHRQHLYRYVVRRRQDLLGVVDTILQRASVALFETTRLREIRSMS